MAGTIGRCGGEADRAVSSRDCFHYADFPLKASFALTLTLLLSACFIGRDQAVIAARLEIARHNITLPQRCVITVQESMFEAESGPTFPIYIVSFSERRPKERIPLYTVNVRRYTGQVQGFLDTHVMH